MADLDPRQMFERLEGATPRPEFVAELRAVIEEEVRAQSDVAVAAPVDVSVVDPAIDIERKKRMSKNVWIGLAAAAVVVVGLLLWVQGGESASELDTVDDVEDTVEVAEEEVPEATTTTSTTTTTTTTTLPEPMPAPDVQRPDPGPAAAPSGLPFEEWIVELTTFAENRHEGDWLHFRAPAYGEQLAILDGALEHRSGYAFTTQCDLLPFTTAHLAEAPGLPENEAIAAAYQALLDADSVTWGFIQAKCDAVDHELARQGLAEVLSLDTDNDQDVGLSFFQLCPALRDVIAEETGVTYDFECEPPADFQVDRELPEGFRNFVDG